MSAAVFAWIVWRDRYPSTPLELDVVQAETKVEAERLAGARWPGVRLLVQSALSARAAQSDPKLPTTRPTYDPATKPAYNPNLRWAKRRARNATTEKPLIKRSRQTPTNPDVAPGADVSFSLPELAARRKNTNQG